MKETTLEILACPTCRGRLIVSNAGDLRAGALTCTTCRVDFPIREGIPHFIQPEALTGFNRRFARMYDWFSWGYRLFSKLAFTFIGMSEGAGRRQITDRLEPGGGRVLEVSIGPGVNLPFLVDRSDVGEVFGLDISLGQLRRCRRYTARKGWEVELTLGNAEGLPFQDDVFESVFHVGGINFFNNQQAAIHEMIRVAKPGTRILIADETEKGARSYEKIIPGFQGSFEGKRQAVAPPLERIPGDMLEVRLFEVWKGWFYCIEFRKP